MKKKEFNYLITPPHLNIKSLNEGDIQSLKKKFPYCETIYNLSLIKAHGVDDINFTEILTTTALYSSNRKNIFNLINPSPKIKPSTPDYKKTFLFEEWLKNPFLLDKQKVENTIIGESIKKSADDNDYLTTETLAKIYVDQEHYKRAIQTYEILCLKYPKKSGFFADQIQKIKNKIG